MFKTIGLASALMILPVMASAQDVPAAAASATTCIARIQTATTSASRSTVSSRSRQSLPAAAQAFGSRMEAFGTRAGAVCADANLNEAQKEARIAALWADYEPDLAAFTSASPLAHSGPRSVEEAASDIEAGALGARALAEQSGGLGIATNSAWASSDPKRLEATTLIVDYALSEASEALETAATALASINFGPAR